MLEFIILFFLFFFSTTGLLFFGLGIIAFLLMPIVPMVTGVGKRLANFHIWMALWCVQRVAIVVSEHNELLFKRMIFDDLGVEKMKFGDDTKEFEDPAAAIHHLFGYPFALADEVHGILFDPRHAAIGKRKQEYDEKNIHPVRATESDWKNHEIHQWVPGVFEIVEDTYELLDLSAIRSIIDGGERAEYPHRVEQLYRISREPFASNRFASLRVFAPVIAFIIILLLFNWMGGNTDADPTSVVGFGSFLLFIAIPYKKRILSVLKPLAVALPVVALIGGGLVLNPLITILGVVAFSFGWLLIPGITFLLKPFERPSNIFGNLIYLKLGLLGYKKPVIKWTQKGYKLLEYDDLGSVSDVKWYGLAGSLIGFTYEPDPDSFGPDIVDANRLESGSEVATDGGVEPDEIPHGYVRCPFLKRDYYGGYIPKRLKNDAFYLNSGIALNRFKDSAIGEKSLRRLLRAKEEYGEAKAGMSDRTLLWATMGSILLSSVLGVFLFF